MENIITKFEILADKSIEIKPKDTTTLITGFSGTGKTLMFKLIKYALGEKKGIDISTAKEQLKGLSAVQITFSNGDVFYRKVDTSFVAKIKHGNAEFIPADEKEYKKDIGALFGHEDIKVLRNESEAKATTFTISEYLNTLFFDEARLTDEKTFIEAEGHDNKIKLKNYYRYFLTGEIIESKIIKDAQNEKKNNEMAEKSLSFLGKQVSKPSSSDRIKRSKLEKQLETLKKQEIDIFNLLKGLHNDITIQKINENKLLSLYDLYNSQLQEIKAADLFDKFMEPAEIKCHNCGESIKWQPIANTESEIARLNGLLLDIKKTITSIEKQIKKWEDETVSLNTKLSTIKVDKETIVDELEKIDKQIENYLAYEKLRSFLAIKSDAPKPATEALEKKEIDIEERFKTQINALCAAISDRLKAWKLKTKTNVGFNHDRFDFTFDGTLRCFLPKGYRGFCTVAVIIELIKHMKTVNVPCFNFILVDTVWKVASFGEEKLEEVVTEFLKDISNTGIQIIIFENENIWAESDKYLHITLGT